MGCVLEVILCPVVVVILCPVVVVILCPVVVVILCPVLVAILCPVVDVSPPSLPERGGSFLGQVWLPFGQSVGLDGLPFSRSSGIVVGIGWPVLCLLE